MTHLDIALVGLTISTLIALIFLAGWLESLTKEIRDIKAWVELPKANHTSTLFVLAKKLLT